MAVGLIESSDGESAVAEVVEVLQRSGVRGISVQDFWYPVVLGVVMDSAIMGAVSIVVGVVMVMDLVFHLLPGGVPPLGRV